MNDTSRFNFYNSLRATLCEQLFASNSLRATLCEQLFNYRREFLKKYLRHKIFLELNTSKYLNKEKG